MQKLRSPPGASFYVRILLVQFRGKRIRTCNTILRGKIPEGYTAPVRAPGCSLQRQKAAKDAKNIRTGNAKRPSPSLQTSSLQDLASFPIESGGTKRRS